MESSLILSKYCKHYNTNKSENDFYSYRPKKCKLCCTNCTKSIPQVNKKEANKKFYLTHKEHLKQVNKDYYHKRKALQQQQITPTL